MPVNTAALKTFAPAMRRQLLEAVGRKLDLLLHSQTPDTLSTYARQIAELREQEAQNREQLLERVAYTWFNRLCALRYLDAKGWHPFGCKVLMPAAEGETQPELLKLMRAGSLPAELKPHTNEARLHGLLDGQIPPAIAGADPQGEVYRELVLASCRSYHQLLPELFEGLDDASELLLPDDLLSEGSIAGAFRSAISDEDCEDVEIIGWLYQFYISEKKDEAMARKKVVPTEDIPAVTQLFTPHWIVRYLVENSLGRLWLLNRPGSKLREHMPYFIEGESETDFLVINKPEEIKLLDPACGSGHMLIYAFDLLSLIYEEEGYAPSEIPSLILRHNLYGLEICPRAAQLAELALAFKSRAKSRRFFQPDSMVRPHILELRDIRLEGGELNDYIEALDLGELFDPSLFKLLHQFQNAKDFGSLIQPCLNEETICNVCRFIEAKEPSSQLILRETHFKVMRLIKQAEALTKRYQVVVANPPYMGSKKMNEDVKSFVKENYEPYKADLFSAFVVRGGSLTQNRGYAGFMTPNVWMYISSHENLRSITLDERTLTTLVELPLTGFDGATVQICAFTFENHPRPDSHGGFIRLIEFKGASNMGPKTLEAIANHDCGWFYCTSSQELKQIPGSPIAYWVSPAVRQTFKNASLLGEKAPVKQGLATSDNERFLRLWHEVSYMHINKDAKCLEDTKGYASKWYPLNKGGAFRRWYGNQEFVINWLNNGEELWAFTATLNQGSNVRLKSREFYFNESSSWSDVTSGRTSARYYPEGFIFDTTGPSVFRGNEISVLFALGLLNSKITDCFVALLNPTLHFTLKDANSFPLPKTINQADVENCVEQLIGISMTDWDDSETSWGFLDQPLLRPGIKGKTLKDSWQNWENKSISDIRRMQLLEEENNRLFIAGYDLEGEMTPEVPEEEISLARAEYRKDIASFLSHATGCMMGRYSLDQPGLILADSRDSQAEQLAAYEAKVGNPLSEVQFKPDPDGIIPVLDGEWFEDDIVARTREFLAVTFPESSVAENLRFIEESLGKDIRKYFCSEFYKDHLQTYKKRPIYWMVQSPKKGFACLIYLHRYTKDTLNQVLNNYFRPYLQKLEARLAQLGLDQLNDDLPTRERTAARKEAEKITKVLKECQTWEQDALLPLAQQRIELDLDDGVKVNYLKLQDVLAPIPGLAAKED
jgi:hypothetical protein